MWFAFGVAVGAGGYYLYDRFFSKAANLGRELLTNAAGDYDKAVAHVRKLF